MAEVLAQFADPVSDETGRRYRAQACGAPMTDGLWEAWIEFAPIDGGPPGAITSRNDAAQSQEHRVLGVGLTAIYLEGALRRALNPPIRRAPAAAEPLFDGPAARRHGLALHVRSAADAVLDPFSVFEKGEVLLRKELGALSPWHLVNIIRAYRLSDEPIDVLNRLPGIALAEIIVEGVRQNA